MSRRSARPTVALELVPTSRDLGAEGAHAEGERVRALSEEAGLWGRLNTIVVPQLIAEESDRPVALTEKLDPLEAKQGLERALPLDFILTQVTAFTEVDALRLRLRALREKAARRVVFVGVPRVFNPAEIRGPMPSEALQLFAEEVPSKGVIFIPTRPDEAARFGAKVRAGADFGLTQLLFSDRIVGVMRELSQLEERPEVLLSFGYVPELELRRGLIKWLIKDETPAARDEMREVDRTAALPFKQKKAEFAELVARVSEALLPLGFPLGLHLECPYGPSRPAMEAFSAALEAFEQVTGVQQVAAF
jgi:hypothetical protein